jgi:hypothetical protein
MEAAVATLDATMQQAQQQHERQAAATTMTTSFLNHMEQTILRLQSALHHVQQQHQALSATQLPHRNRDAIAQLSTEALAPAKLVLTLDLDFAEAGEEGSAKRAAFARDVTDDLSRAAGVSAANLLVQRVSAGSVNSRLDLEITAHASPASPPPHVIAALLCAQAADPSSTLRTGKLTCRTREIQVMSKDPAVRAEERGFIAGMAAQMQEVEQAIAKVQSTVEGAQVQLHATKASRAAGQVSVASAHGCIRAGVHTCKYACLE